MLYKTSLNYLWLTQFSTEDENSSTSVLNKNHISSLARNGAIKSIDNDGATANDKFQSAKLMKSNLQHRYDDVSARWIINETLRNVYKSLINVLL